MSSSIYRQRGISFYSFLFFMAIVVFFAITGTKLGPRYLEFLTVKSVMKDVKNDPDISATSRSSVLRTIGNRLNINGVDDVSVKDFTYKKVDNGFELSVQYEVREHLYGNIDAVLTFSNKVDINGQ